MNPPCRWKPGRLDGIGKACPACGHTNILHPGKHNPELVECTVCELELLVEALGNIK